MHVAIDLGAGSGRAFLGHVGGAGLTLQEVHRFTYGPRPSDGRLRWDMTALHGGLVAGLAAARVRRRVGRRHAAASIGVDAWGVDYGLVDRRRPAGRGADLRIATRAPTA